MEKKNAIILVIVLLVIFSGIVVGRNLVLKKNKDEKIKIMDKTSEEYIDEISNKMYEYSDVEDKIQKIEDRYCNEF